MERVGVLIFFGLMLVLVLGQDVTYERAELNGHIFSIPDTQLPWAQSVEACEARGQKLASVESIEKDDILVQLFVEKKNTNVTLKGNSWVSATEKREGVWYWQSLDKPLYHSRWFMDGQPDDTENLNCVYLAAQWLLYWRDANCSASMYYICEGEPTIPGTTTSGVPESTTSGMPESTPTPGGTTSGKPETTTNSSPVWRSTNVPIVLTFFACFQIPLVLFSKNV